MNRSKPQGACVEASACGCEDAAGGYRSAGAQWSEGGCSRACECAAGGQVRCDPTPGCMPGQTCRLNRVRGDW